MSSLMLMSFLDIARSLGKTPLDAIPEDVSAFISREFRKSGGTFNYNTSINSLAPLFQGRQSVQDAVEYCASSGAPAGRKPNSAAVEIVGPYAATQLSTCYKIPFSAVPIGRLPNQATAYMGIKAPLVRVKDGDVFVVVPGFRLGHRPVGVEIDVAASLALATFARDDFIEADYEYLDCSRGRSGQRELSVYRGRDRRIFDLDEVDHMLDLYVQGLALTVASGAAMQTPNFRGYRIIDPDQPRMI